MTTEEEQDYLRSYARSEFRAEGEVVDLGCWLGSTTIPLAEGLAENPCGGQTRVFAYDLFVWRHWMEDYARELAGQFREGDSFRAEFEKRVARFGCRIVTCSADLRKTRWCAGPIEFLDIDSMKDLDLCRGIVRGFFGSLIPGRSVIMHQDFKWWGAPWIHLFMYRWRTHFSLIRDLEHSSGTVFRLERALPRDEVESGSFLDNISASEIRAAFSHWLRCLKGGTRWLLFTAEVFAMLDLGRTDLARVALWEAFTWARRLPPGFLADLGERAPELLQELEDARPPSDLEGATYRARSCGRPILIWGAGSAGRRLMRQLPWLRTAASGLIDSDGAKRGSLVEGLRVAAPASLEDSPDRPFIIIASTYAAEIAGDLRRRGYAQTVDFRVADLGQLDSGL